MKNFKIISIIISAFFLGGCAHYKPMFLAKNVNLQKYMGKWHEIARLPNFFQKKCSDTTAEYKIINKDDISVKNKCYKGKELSSVTGKAWRSTKGINNKLKVQFFWPFTGNYWILYLSKDYRNAVVGEPSRSYLWFLSRDKYVSNKQLSIFKNIALKNNYNLKPLIIEKHV